MSKGDAARNVEVPLQTSTARKTSDALLPGMCLPVDRHDVFFDGDLVTVYEVIWRDDLGEVHQGRAVVGTGGPRAKWAVLDPVQRHGDGAMSRLLTP